MSTRKKEIKVGDLVSQFGIDFLPLKWYERVYYYPQWKWMDFKYWVQQKYQSFKYGFPLAESWNFNTHHAAWCLPRLKKLRENKTAYPGIAFEEPYDQYLFDFYKKDCEDISVKKWNDVLDKIIWAFENFDNVPEPIKPEDYDDRSKVVAKDKRGTTYEAVDQRPWDWTPVREHQQKIQEGLDLFAKYYVNLWD